MIERPQWYVETFSNPNAIDGFSAFSLAFQINPDAPFRMFGIAFYCYDASGLPQGAAANVNVLVRFTRPDGTTYTQRHQIPMQAVQPFSQQAPDGAGGQTAPYYSLFGPISPNQLFPPQTTVTFDVSDLPGTATTSIKMVLCGTSIYQDGAVWSPTYPAKYSALPFDYQVQIQVGNNLPVLNVPFTVLPDADFVWQRGAQTDQTGTPPPPG